MNDNIIRTTYNSKEFGSLRVFCKDGNFYYCANDICRILDMPRTAVRNYCRNVVKEVHDSNGGIHVMNFIGNDDLMNIYDHSKSETADDFVISLDDIEESFKKTISAKGKKSECYEDTHDPGYLKLLDKIGHKSDGEDRIVDIVCFIADFLDDFIEFLNSKYQKE